jgi:glucose/arabinose dehydrogenase
VGGDPIVNPADFRVTTFASGLNYPTGVLAEPDGSLLVVENVTPAGGTNFYGTTAEIVRLVDTNGDGVADGSPTVLASGLPGADSAIIQAGPYVITTSSFGTISFLHTGATPTAPLSLSGTINLAFPSPWEHTTYALAVRPAPGQSGDYNVFFNIGSQFNGIKKDAQGNILFNSNGVAIPDPTIGKVQASGLISGTLIGDSIYMVTLHDNGGTPVLSGLTQIATGLRNAASMAINPATGDLLFADNGMDGIDGGNEAYSTDTLHRIAAADIGKSVPNYGFPYSYSLTNVVPNTPETVVDPAGRVPPLASFQPLYDPNLPSTGSESEGASGFAISPSMFPAGVNNGVFIGFHGVFNTGGLANEENSMLFADPNTGKYFDFISNDEPNIGHLDGATSTADSLFVSDVASDGQVFGSPADGAIYQIKSITVNGLVADPGFEQVAVGAGHFQYAPAGSPWSFSGGAGISGNNSGFTSGNPPAPQGAQVAFLQETGSFSDTVAGWAAGSYALTFTAAQRGNHQASHQDFEVLVDGKAVGTFTPSSKSYQGFSTAVFSVTAGAHTVTFQGLDSAGGDNTAFVDLVTVVHADTSNIADPGFEQVAVGAGHFQYDPAGSPWSFSGSAGISGNNSGFTSGNPPAPQGLQVAFLQQTGSFSQTVTGWAAGSYVLNFVAAQRGVNQASHEDFEVLVDGKVVGTFTPSSKSYQSYSTLVFSVTAGAHTVTFQGLDSAGGDNTALIDQVAVVQAVIPAVEDPGFEQVAVGSGHFQYDPAGSPWSFSGSAGVSGNSSGFTAGNPPAPQGSQVAFLQQTGSFSQSVTGWAAGSYVLSFVAAQRGINQASHEDFEVLVDGKVVATFTPSSKSYQSYSTAVFSVTAGAHTVTFKGLDTAGGDNTAFIDGVTVT